MDAQSGPDGGGVLPDQWVAGCGTDPAPYFRVFNPVTQSEKFDANGTYIRRTSLSSLRFLTSISFRSGADGFPVKRTESNITMTQGK
jgi:hypothetical protein